MVRLEVSEELHLQNDLRTDRKLSASSFDSIVTPHIARDMEDSQIPTQNIEYRKIWIIHRVPSPLSADAGPYIL